MNIRELTEEQRNKVINDCIYTGKHFKTIAKENGILIENVYEIMNEYCKDNNYAGFRRTAKGVVFEKSIKGKILENAKEIESWSNEHERKPREVIKGVNLAKKREEESEEQKELRLGIALRSIKINIIRKYRKMELDQIEDEEHREIVRIIREIYKNFRNNKEFNNKEKELRCLKNVEEIEIWSNEHGRKRIEIDKKLKGNKKLKALKNAEEIESWSNEHERKPRIKIKGVNPAEKREEESEEQKELRLGIALRSIRINIIRKYRGMEVEKIEDEEHRKIVKIIRGIDEKYEKNISGLVKRYDNQRLAKMILNLVVTRNATMEQIQKMADYYEVDLEETMNSLDER